MTEQELQAIKEGYENMDWEGFRENAGDLVTREIEIYDTVVIEGVPMLIAEMENYKQLYKICDRGMLNVLNRCEQTQVRLDRTELAEAQARMEVDRLRREITHIRELWRYGTPEEVYDNLPRIAQMILNDEEGEWIG